MSSTIEIVAHKNRHGPLKPVIRGFDGFGMWYRCPACRCLMKPENYHTNIITCIKCGVPRLIEQKTVIPMIKVPDKFTFD